MVAVTTLRRQRRQRLASIVHRLGARAVFELLDEIVRYHHLADDIDHRLARYAAADRDVLRAVGGDRFPPPPLRVVSGSRR